MYLDFSNCSTVINYGAGGIINLKHQLFNTVLNTLYTVNINRKFNLHDALNSCSESEPQSQLFMVLALWQCISMLTERLFKEFILSSERGEFLLDM